MCVFCCWYGDPLTPKVRKVKFYTCISLTYNLYLCAGLHFSDQTSRQTNPIHLGGQSSTLEGENYADEGNDGDDDDGC